MFGVVLSLFFGLVTAHRAGAQCGLWIPGAPLNPMAGSSGGSAYAATFWDPDGDGPMADRYVVGGAFSVAGGGAADNVAAWDGEAWAPLGPGFNGAVWAVAVLEGDLVAAGSFAASGEREVLHVARWDGSGWEPMGEGLDGTVLALLVHQGSLYAGGFFLRSGKIAMPSLARWDGTRWNAVGTGPSGPVFSLATYGGELVVGTNGTIESWTGSMWRTLAPSGTNWLSVNALAVYQGELYAGGQSIGSNTSLRRYDGTSWTAVTAAPFSVSSGVQSLAVFEGELYIGGSMYHTGMESPNLLRWNGNNWRSVGSGASHWVRSLVAHGDRLFAAGSFRSVSATPAGGAAAWDGSAWEALGTGIGAASVRSMLAYQDEVVLAGVIAGPGGGGSLAAWDGSAIRYFGELDSPASVAEALVEFDGRLIVGGGFRRIDGVTASLIAAWDGTAWSALGGGRQLPVSGYRSPGGVKAMVVHGKELVVAGTLRDGVVSAWDGAAWRALGTGVASVSQSTVGEVHALASHRGDVIAGGWFVRVGGVPTVNIAAWNGSAWRALGDGLGQPGEFAPTVYALLSVGKELYAGGEFDRSGTIGVRNIARWDGTSWRPLGEGLNGPVRAMAAVDGSIYVGGQFTVAGETPAAGIARWDGEAWHALGAGVARGVSARVLSLLGYEGELIVGGEFTNAGGQEARFWARWVDRGADFDADGAVNSQDFFSFLAAFFAADLAADFNADGVVSSQDFFDFLGVFFSGC
jgi:hypothetical protein